MSAFMMDKEDFDIIVLAAQDLDHGHFTWYHPHEEDGVSHHKLEDQDEFGQILVNENIKSVAYRYGEPDDVSKMDLPGPISQWWKQPYTFGRYLRPTTVEKLKLLDCYEYQSCEHPDWEKSEAHTILQVLRKRLISRLPGYEDAPWDGWANKN